MFDAWSQQFIANARKPKEQRNQGELTASELEVFTEEMEALERRKPVPKKSLALTLLADGLLRSNTRLRNSDELSDETKLSIMYDHEVEVREIGVNFTINHLREKYLVIHCRQIVKRCVRSCASVKGVFEDNLYNRYQKLPEIRLDPLRIVVWTSGASYLTKQGRGLARAKRFFGVYFFIYRHTAVNLEQRANRLRGGTMYDCKLWSYVVLESACCSYFGAILESMIKAAREQSL